MGRDGWKRLWFLVFSMLIGAGCVVQPADAKANYGEPVVYAVGKKLIFADFVLEYQGERRVSSELFPQGFLYHDFLVTAGEETQTVSWSSGTGDIGPQPFTSGGNAYLLEMQRSDELGSLPDRTLVIWKDR